MKPKKTLAEWARLDVNRVRLSHWANPLDYVLLDVFEGALGPWVHLYSPLQEILGLKTPQTVFVGGIDRGCAEWEQYDGPINAQDYVDEVRELIEADKQ